MARLTKTYVDKLKPRARRFDVYCDTLRGFSVRVNADGTKTAAFRYHRDGSRHRVTIGVLGPKFTFDRARRQAEILRGEVQGGAHPARDRNLRRQAPTFAEVAERHMTEIAEPKRKATTLRNYRGMLAIHILPALGRMKVGEIERADVERLHRRVGKSAPGAANRVLALVSVIMTSAERWAHRPPNSNPCRGVEKFKERKMDRFLTAEERARLDAVLTAALAASKGQPLYVAHGSVHVVRLLSLTGARSGEITSLQWSMVDFERSCLRLPDSKTGQKIIPLTPSAVALLRELAAASKPGVPWVCAGERGGPVNNLRRAWLALRERAGLEDVRLHDLRHSAASDALASGVPLALVGAMLGHKHPQTTQRYAHLNDATLQEAARMMGEAIERNTREGAELLRQRAVGDDQGVGDDRGKGGADVVSLDSRVIPLRRRRRR